ncbi:subclass B1 metallo-beta-lactamase [Adhaeribacter rhizoryzae]|uniref:beta-lactamase n=1 Tax=Adhaeribacter rhizoryzae TaxID=2607907 RepID=A0A5M6DBX7_9BACT|nr:subclass B1 metallo-beta-lactamase [Adhaeribacter rhizoryzae]KAA5545054.1 subclass B1 metallo-beta-lactamase [Adhaeribacter rhizoryzae]
MLKQYKYLIISLILFACNGTKQTPDAQNYQSEILTIQQVSDHVYQHTSYLVTESFGKVTCNGMIVFSKNEAIIFDTPTDNNAAAELISWVEDTLHGKVKAIIATHFHADCLGGLEAFHKRKIPSYANNLTIQLAGLNNLVVPQNGFNNLLQLEVVDKKVLAQFWGEGHTKDNVIGYFPEEEVLFGGCLIKEMGAEKGNLADANVQAWPKPITKLKDQYPDARIVIPGHGKPGGTELLDYTIKLFGQN